MTTIRNILAYSMAIFFLTSCATTPDDAKLLSIQAENHPQDDAIISCLAGTSATLASDIAPSRIRSLRDKYQIPSEERILAYYESHLLGTGIVVDRNNIYIKGYIDYSGTRGIRKYAIKQFADEVTITNDGAKSLDGLFIFDTRYINCKEKDIFISVNKDVEKIIRKLKDYGAPSYIQNLKAEEERLANEKRIAEERVAAEQTRIAKEKAERDRQIQLIAEQKKAERQRQLAEGVRVRLETQAKNGDTTAQIQLGRECLAQGQPSVAAVWLSKALDSGSFDAIKCFQANPQLRYVDTRDETVIQTEKAKKDGLEKLPDVEPLDGYLKIRWDSSESEVRSNSVGKVVSSTLCSNLDDEHLKSACVLADTKYLLAVMKLGLGQLKLLTTMNQGKQVEYLLLNDKLCLVIFTPLIGVRDMQSYLDAMDSKYGAHSVKPTEAGSQYMEGQSWQQSAYEWNNAKGVARLIARSNKEHVQSTKRRNQEIPEENQRRRTQIVAAQNKYINDAVKAFAKVSPNADGSVPSKDEVSAAKAMMRSVFEGNDEEAKGRIKLVMTFGGGPTSEYPQLPSEIQAQGVPDEKIIPERIIYYSLLTKKEYTDKIVVEVERRKQKAAVEQAQKLQRETKEKEDAAKRQKQERIKAVGGDL